MLCLIHMHCFIRSCSRVACYLLLKIAAYQLPGSRRAGLAASRMQVRKTQGTIQYAVYQPRHRCFRSSCRVVRIISPRSSRSASISLILSLHSVQNTFSHSWRMFYFKSKIDIILQSTLNIWPLLIFSLYLRYRILNNVLCNIYWPLLNILVFNLCKDWSNY